MGQPIDIRKISDMSCVASRNFGIGQFIRFVQVGEDYVFGCTNGVALTNTKFELLSIVTTKE